MTALEQLGRYVTSVGRRPLLDEVRNLVELHLIDSVGAWIAGTKTTEGCMLREYRAAMLGLGQGEESLPIDLTTRCALTRLSEIDDIHLPSMTTPGGIVVPATLTIANAMKEATSNDVVAAIVAGYEVMTRLGCTLDGPTILYRGIWPTYLLAPAAVAAVAARLLGLDEKQTTNALAMALTSASPGVGHQNAPATARWYAVGTAAAIGLGAAAAAKQGFASDVELVEGNFFPGVYGITPNIAALTEDLENTTVLPAVSFKPWCAARQTMGATLGLYNVLKSGFATPETITEVRAFVPPPHLKMINHGVTPGDRLSHLTSLPYQLAVLATAPELAYDVQQSLPELTPDIRDFMSKIKVDSDEGFLSDYPLYWRARVEVDKGVHTMVKDVTWVPGDPGAPFDRENVNAKFRQFVLPVLGPGLAEHILKHCSEMFTSLSVRTLVFEIEAACAHMVPLRPPSTVTH